MKLRYLWILLFMAIPAMMSAALTGVVGEVYAVDGIPGYTTYRIYAEFDDDGDQCTAQYGYVTETQQAPLRYTTTGTWYQNEYGGATANNINPALFGAFPDLEFDSFLTVGDEDDSGNLQIAGFNTNETAFESFEAGNSWIINDIFGGLIINLPGPIETDPSNYPVGGKVLLAQLTTETNSDIELEINISWRSAAQVTSEGSGFIIKTGCTDPDACNYDATATIDDISRCDFTSCAGCLDSEACNYDETATIDDESCEYTSCLCAGDFNNNGLVEIQDLLIFLSDWGCTSNCATDLNQDGSVNALDGLAFIELFGTTCE